LVDRDPCFLRNWSEGDFRAWSSCGKVKMVDMHALNVEMNQIFERGEWFTVMKQCG
jgi:hypothetical protein